MVPRERPTGFAEVTLPPSSWKWRSFVSAKTLFVKMFNDSLTLIMTQKHFSFPFCKWSLQRKLIFILCKRHIHSYCIIVYLNLIWPTYEIGVIIIVASRKFYYSLKVPWNTALCDLKPDLKTIVTQKIAY